MSKPSAPPPGFMAPGEAPPTYNQAVGGGVNPHAPYSPQPPVAPPGAYGASPYGPPPAPGYGGPTTVQYVNQQPYGYGAQGTERPVLIEVTRSCFVVCELYRLPLMSS